MVIDIHRSANTWRSHKSSSNFPLTGPIFLLVYSHFTCTVMYTSLSLWLLDHLSCGFYGPVPLGGSIKQWCCLTSVICLSRTSWILMASTATGGKVRWAPQACMGWSWAAPCAGAGAMGHIARLPAQLAYFKFYWKLASKASAISNAICWLVLPSWRNMPWFD